MEHECLFCSTPFAAKREGKNYCSNTCRQKAFYKRNATEQGSNITCGNGTVGTVPLGVGGEAPAAGPATEQHVNREPVYVKTAQETATDNGGTVVRETVPQDGAKAGATGKTPVTQTMQPPATGMASAVKTGSGGKAVFATGPGPYQWVSSRFNDEVEELSEGDGAYGIFLSPQMYLTASEKEKVVWVSLRLRSLLESLLQLHRGNKALCSELRWVRKAFTALQGSEQFNGLTAKFPYKALIKELEQVLVKITGGYGKHELITVRYSRKRKQAMIAARYNLSALVPGQRPGELFPKEQKKPREGQATERQNSYELRAASLHLPYRKRKQIFNNR
jgi:hypothetical protein